jgi:DNA-directed RNA polymerase beta' subunit
MNLNFPQTARARAEVRHLLAAHMQLITAATSSPIMGLVFNCPTAAYLMSTDTDAAPTTPIITETEYADLVRTLLLDDTRAKTLPVRLAANGVTPRTPRAILSLAFPPDFFYRRRYIDKEEVYNQETFKVDKKEIRREVLIRNGVFVRGDLVKTDVKNGIIHSIHLKYGANVTGRFISEASFILDWYLERRGFSIGFADCLLTDRAFAKTVINRAIAETRAEVDRINLVDAETRFQREAQEAEINLVLGKSIKAAADLTKGSLTGKTNPLGIMVHCGAKGSANNMAQIAGALGEQFISGKRPPTSVYGNRTLCYFERDDKRIEARGFVVHSFIEGLSPAEFVFHMGASRVGLLDSAAKTADIGALNRRAQKMLENEKVDYFGGVSNAVWMYNSLAYGEGYSPQELVLVKSFKSTGEIYMPFDLASIVDELNSQ